METLQSLIQIIVLLFVTLGVIAAVELCLYWLLFFFRRGFLFWIVTLLGGAIIGFASELWLGSSGSQGLGNLSRFLNPTLWGLGTSFFAAYLSRFFIKGRHSLAIMMLAPAFIAVSLLVLYPFLFQFELAFSNLNLYTINAWKAGEPLKWVGFKNFEGVIFSNALLQTAGFWDLLLRTFLWTAINLVFHVGLGLGLALLLNRKLFARGFYRMLLIIPWAMPQIVAVLAWRGEFHPQFGFVNIILEWIGMGQVNWWSDPLPVFISCCIVNIWLGIPFMMIVFLGGLQSISHSYYEAAAIDGASKWAQFREITLPMLKPVVVPSVTLGTIWTFNNINVIYLMTGQDGGKEYADILVSALYKSAFAYSRYSFSAAFAIVIFSILIAITVIWMKISKGTESVVGNR